VGAYSHGAREALDSIVRRTRFVPSSRFRSNAVGAKPESSPRRALAWLVAIFVVAFAVALPGNGTRRPLDSHEVFVARTAVEMERRGDLVVPYFASHERLQKPPLSYWLAMLSAEACNESSEPAQSEFSARLPSIILGAATAVLVACLGWLVFDSLWIGAVGALLFATCNAYIDWSRSAQPEMVYTFCCALFVLAATAAQQRSLAGRGTWLAALGAWTAVALAILAKGPILPVALLAGAAIAMRRGAGGKGILRTLHVPAGILWMLALTLPYFAVVALRVPGAVEFWRSQMFDRTGGVSAAWWKPLELFYVGQALGNWMPWSLLLVLLPFASWRARRAARQGLLDPAAAARERGARFLGWIAVVPCVLLSFSAGRKGYYLLPTYPVVAALLAWTGVEAFAAMRERALLRALRAQAALLASAVGGVLVLIALRRRWLELPTGEWLWVSALLALALCCAALAFLAARGRPHRSAALLAACAVLGAGAVGASGIESRIRRYTQGDFAHDVARTTSWDRPLLVLDGDREVLLFYTDRPAPKLEPEELSGELAREPAPWIVTRESELGLHGVPGRVVVREERPPDEDPLVLVDPTQELEPAESAKRFGR
jgi:4-amino-4-deoxy-L-arabinose transferase-like glycosyltransferase